MSQYADDCVAARDAAALKRSSQRRQVQSIAGCGCQGSLTRLPKRCLSP